MKGLSERQRDLLNFIHDFINHYNYSPSYKEIMEHFSFSSSGSVYKHIRNLKRKGVLTYEEKCSRSIRPLETFVARPISTEVILPLAGIISTNNAIEMFAQSQTLAISASMISDKENTYALRVEGNGFDEEMITHGDLLLIEARQDPHEGELVVGLINQHDILLKRYYSEGQYIRLEGHAHQPVILRTEHLQIHGIVIGLIRTY